MMRREGEEVGGSGHKGPERGRWAKDAGEHWPREDGALSPRKGRFSERGDALPQCYFGNGFLGDSMYSDLEEETGKSSWREKGKDGGRRCRHGGRWGVRTE